MMLNTNWVVELNAKVIPFSHNIWNMLFDTSDSTFCLFAGTDFVFFVVYFETADRLRDI